MTDLPEKCSRCERPLSGQITRLQQHGRRRVLSGTKAGQPTWHGLLQDYLCGDCSRDLEDLFLDNGFVEGSAQRALADKYREVGNARRNP